MSEKDSSFIQSPADTRPDRFDEFDDGINLKDIILALWGYRVKIIVISMAITLVIIAAGSFKYLGQQKRSVAKLQVRLDFEGVEKNQYPNGMKFSTSDILSMPVLSKVYKEDNLEEYVKFRVFKTGLSVIQTNDSIRFLEYDYAAKLSDKKLNVDQRKRLETEFLEKKRGALVPVYTLLWDTSGVSIPSDIIAKVMNDIMQTWTEYAIRVKGADMYQVSLVSRNVLSKEDIENEDYLIGVDILRLGIKRVKNDINKLMAIPGARTFKTGKDRISLVDIDYRLTDLENFKLSPLGGLIRHTGISKDVELSRAYLLNRIFELNRKNEEAVGNAKVYENSMNKYMQLAAGIVPTLGSATSVPSSSRSGMTGNVPAMIPQFGSSFLTSLIEMAQESSDAKFRQDITQKIIDAGLKRVEIDGELKYYQLLLKQLTTPESVGKFTEKFIEYSKVKIKNTMDNVFTSLMGAIDELNNMYHELCKMNLNPASVLYTVTQPLYMVVEKPIKAKKIMMYMILAWILAEGMLIFLMLAVSSFTRPNTTNRRRQ